MTHEDYMRQALLLAQEAYDAGEVPVGCVIVKDGQIVGRGRNRREEKQSALSHAEMEAIADACRTLGGWRLGGTKLYVTLEPCPMCAGGIISARIPEIYYGAKDRDFHPEPLRGELPPPPQNRGPHPGGALRRPAPPVFWGNAGKCLENLKEL